MNIRHALLIRQNEEIEAAKGRIKTLAGYEKLSSERAYHVLRPLQEVLSNLSEHDLSPKLLEIKERFASKMAAAEELARDRLDEERNRLTDKKVVKIEANLRGREIHSREQLQAFFRELEERIGPVLDRGDRVRLG